MVSTWHCRSSNKDLMEGQVRMMHEAYDVLHGGVSVTTLQRLDTDMVMALAEPLIEVGRLPTRSREEWLL